MSKLSPDKLTRYTRSLTPWLLLAALATAALSSASAAKLAGRLRGDESRRAEPAQDAPRPRASVKLRAAANAAPLAARDQGGSGGAFVTTDQTDYKPGETVVIFGSGWAAGETVSLSLHEEAAGRADTELSAVADEYGNILNTEFSPAEENRGSSFTLTATGQSSGRTATAKFTDGGIMSYSPNSVSLTAFSGASGSSSTSFTQTVTAPSGNGNFQAPAQVTSVGVGGGTPMPTSWVSVTGGTGNFVTGPANNPRNPPTSRPGTFR